VNKRVFGFAALGAAAAGLLGWLVSRPIPTGVSNPIVGAWLVKAPGAPFQYHMFLFGADGTLQQSNPDAGDAGTSDSNGMGVWIQNSGRITGKFVEVMADRATRSFVSRGEISFDIKVDGDAFRGTANGRFYDADGALVRGPLPTALEGQRIRP
jgi:hypothetical protein